MEGPVDEQRAIELERRIDMQLVAQRAALDAAFTSIQAALYDMRRRLEDPRVRRIEQLEQENQRLDRIIESAQ